MFNPKIWGDNDSWRETLWVSLSMFVALLGFKLVENAVLGADHPPFNWLEFTGTLFGLITVWLARTENILSWPTGIICVLCLGFFFLEIGLIGQAFLNLVFFFGVSLWGWYNWAYGGRDWKGRSTELEVTLMEPGERMIFVGIIFGLSAVAWGLIGLIAPWSQYPWLDSIVVASSIVAQYLLAQKKVESWWLWFGPVNALSIVLFWLSGAYTVMALYVAFFIHAGFAIKRWSDARV